MPGVPDQTITTKIEDAMQRQTQLDDTEVRSEMSASIAQQITQDLANLDAQFVVNHVGLQFQELRSLVKRLKDAGTPIITEEVAGASYDVDADDLAWNPGAGAHLAFARAPNGTRVELYENKELGRPVANHHIHFNNPEVDAMKAWYVSKLGPKPGQRSGMEAADIGGVNLTFSPADEKPAGTKGRALDHIGFEVDGLEALCKKLEAEGITFDRPYQKIPELGVAVAFFTDPWGTYIELTEGLDAL